jgi:hypothetical protein
MYLNDVKRIGKFGRDAEVETANKAQERTLQIAASIKQLSEETNRAKQSEVFPACCCAISRFHNYSYGNQTLGHAKDSLWWLDSVVNPYYIPLSISRSLAPLLRSRLTNMTSGSSRTCCTASTSVSLSF